MAEMIFGLSLCLIAQTPLSRDSFGVPIIRAKSETEMMYWAGYAVAEDRMWQMENSRRQARYQLSEAFGAKYLAADKEQANSAYTTEELQKQFDALPERQRKWFAAYADGVNHFLTTQPLPPEYAANNLKPRPWDVLDSAAICIRLVQIFGRGGAGELRNWALYEFISGQPKLKGKALDGFDDFAWQNDPKAVPTCLPEDDKVKPPVFPNPTREQTIAHLSRLPKLGVFDLLPGVRVVSNEETKQRAIELKTPFKSGSYCVAVNKSRSATGNAHILSAPQMGFSVPSIIHEVSMHCPTISVAGMDLPGVPGVLIGTTENAAWGLTTGVADTEDIYVMPETESKTRTQEIEIQVKDAKPEKFTKRHTPWGPIVFEAKGNVFARKRSYEGRELQSYLAVTGLWGVKNKRDFDREMRKATMNFNVFIALKNGDIGWRYVGSVPRRSSALDPRFPLPIGEDSKWQGMVPFDQMPNVWNPKSGVIANWNNKPAAWWPNLDTPAWGEAFRNVSLLQQLKPGKLNPDDLLAAAKGISRVDPKWHALKAFYPDKSFDGQMLEGSADALVYDRWVMELRNELIKPVTGNLGSDSNFALVVQPDVMLKALRGETKVDYLAGRSATEVCTLAHQKAKEWAGNRVFSVGKIPVGSGIAPIEYSTRGTYIQLVELGKSARNVVTPGVAERGAFATNQAEIARAFGLKEMTIK